MPSPPVRRHPVTALGDDVPQHFVGAAAEPHQRRHPVEPFEEAAERSAALR